MCGLCMWGVWCVCLGVWCVYIQARSQGGRGGGSDDPPPPVAHPKDFVPPFSNFVPPFSNFVPPFSNFVPPLEYVDDVTRAMSRGGVRLVFHPSKFRPPPTWLAGYGPDIGVVPVHV